MAKKVLALCGSPYQILVVNKVVDDFYKEDDVTLILCDTIANVFDVYQNARKEKRFKNVYLWNVKDRFSTNRKHFYLQAIQGYSASRRIMNVYNGLKEKYEVFLYSNTSAVVMHTMNVLKKNSSNILFEMFEDGFSTYSLYTGNFFDSLRKLKKFPYRIFRDTSRLYVFNDDIMGWTPKFEIKRITTDFEKDTQERINRIFSYKTLTDDYNKKVVFFEESYAADGKVIDDLELLEEISKIVGKNNIIVKIHPRNPTNRFSKSGYITNTNISIPWEVIVLNMHNEETVFVTIASNAAMNPFFLFGKKNLVVLLFKCTDRSESLYTSIIDYDSKLCAQYSKTFFIPESVSQLKDFFAMLRKERINEDCSNCSYEIK